MTSLFTYCGKAKSKKEEDKNMPLKDFLDYAANHPQETVTWDLGGRFKPYTGKLTVVERKKYLLIETDGFNHPMLCSADRESKFSRTHTIKDKTVVLLEAA